MELSIFNQEFQSTNYYNIVMLYIAIVMIDKICKILARNGLCILKIYQLSADIEEITKTNETDYRSIFIQNAISIMIGITPYLNMLVIVMIPVLTLAIELMLSDENVYREILNRVRLRKFENDTKQ